MLETFVGPLKNNDPILLNRYEQTLRNTDVSLIPVTTDILRRTATIRADFNLKTPDAIHAASGLQSGCVQFITNDPIFRRVTGLNVIVLRELN